MLPALRKIPSHVVSLEDYEPLARERLSPAVWAYLSGAAGDEATLAENRSAFNKHRIVPRILTDLSACSTHLVMAGREYEHPLFVAPTAYHRLFHPEAELATIMGAAAYQAGMVVSTQATVPLEDLAAAGKGPLWFQLYIQPDREFTLELVKRAEAAAYQALVVTVDAPLSGLRNREQRAGFQLPPGIEAVNLRGMLTLSPQDRIFGSALLQASPTWKDLSWLLSRTHLPIWIKGILAPEDARMALGLGVAGIIVSNHGGRTLDSVPATLDALPAVAAAVDGAVPIIIDGGIRRGTDVFKAIHCGADAVMVGRPILHGLAAAGALGVAHVLKILLTELEVTMALSGCSTLADIRRAGSVARVL